MIYTTALGFHRNDTAVGPSRGASPSIKMTIDAGIPRMTLGDAPVDSFDGRWHVARLKTREERAFAEDCERRGLQYFVPFRRERKRYPDGSKKVIFPALFSSYGFFCGDGNEIYLAQRCRSFQGFLRETLESDPHSSLSVIVQRQLKHDLAWLHRGLIANPEVEGATNEIPVGTEVEITAGAMRGFKGPIISRSGKFQAVVQVHFMGSAVAVDVDSTDIELIDAA